MKFLYKAKTKEGKETQGEIEAADRRAVVEALAKQGAHPILIHEVKGGGKVAGGKKGLFAPKVKSKDLVLFTRQLSTMISAGVPLTRCLQTLEMQAENEYFKSVIAAIAKDAESGISLGDAFGKHPDIFSEVYINMVKAGEAGGILDDILKRLAVQTEKTASMKKKIKSAMTYPTAIFTMTIVGFFGLVIFVIPKLGKILKDLAGPDVQLPVQTRALMAVGDFATGSTIIPHVPNMVFVVAAAVICIVYLKKYISTPKGKLVFHGLLLRMPVVKVVITKVAISSFSRTFASLAAAGVPVLEALRVTGGAIGNKVIESELVTAAKEVQEGKPLSAAIAKSQHFPPIVPQMLAVGEETGQIDTILVKVADFYDEEVDALIDGLSSVIEPMMILVLGAMVGLIAASVMGPIASLSQNIGS